MRCVMVEDTENYFIVSHFAQVSRGGSRIFFRRGCTRLLLYFNTNKPHSFFFGEYQLYQKTAGHLRGGGGGAHPLYPPPRSAPGFTRLNCFALAINCQKNAKM